MAAGNKEEERQEEGGKETVAEVFGEEKGGKELHCMWHGAHIKGLRDTTVKDLEKLAEIMLMLLASIFENSRWDFKRLKKLKYYQSSKGEKERMKN